MQKMKLSPKFKTNKKQSFFKSVQYKNIQLSFMGFCIALVFQKISFPIIFPSFIHAWNKMHNCQVKQNIC